MNPEHYPSQLVTNPRQHVGWANDKRWTNVGTTATCPAIHNDTTNKIEKYELFSENPEDLKLIYQKLTTTMEKLENV